MGNRKKPKVKRDPIAAPDEFISWSARLLLWAQSHLKLLLLGLGVVVLAAGGWGYYQKWQHQRQETAAELFQASTGRQSDPASLEQELTLIIREYPHTGAALQARLALANLLFREKKYSQALEHYQALNQVPALRELVAINLSYCYEALQDYERALLALEPLRQQPDSPWYQDVLLHQARLLERRGELAQALSIYQKLLQQQPSPNLKPFLQEKVAALGG